MLRRIALPLLTLVVVGAVTIGAVGADWPIYRGPGHNGISAETGWLKGEMKIAWSAQVGTGCSSIAVADGKVYTMGNAANKDTVFCFDAATGKEVWKYTYPCPLAPKLYEGGPNATPTVAGGKVYTLSKSGHAFCFNAADGKKVWGIKVDAKAPSWGFAGSPLVVGKKVILNVGSSGTALDAATGKVVWSNGTGASGYSTPVPYEVGGKTLIALFCADGVVAMQADDGKTVWQHPWKTSYKVNAADPIILEGGKKVFVSSGYGTGCALLDVSGTKPKEIWRNKNMRNKHTNSVVYKGAVFGFDESKLTCLDLASGEKKWTEGSLGKGSLMLADGKLIILSETGKVAVADASADAYKELAAVQAVNGKCWSVPVLSGGRIYAKSKKGAFACIAAQ
jgi:outer membrane protein assembly factor BamB